MVVFPSCLLDRTASSRELDCSAPVFGAGASIDSTDSPVPRTGQTFRTEGSVRVGAACGLLGSIVLVIYGATAHGASSNSTTVGER